MDPGKLDVKPSAHRMNYIAYELKFKCNTLFRGDLGLLEDKIRLKNELDK